MTRDEVTVLSDEELRIKAAELVGWEEIRAGAFDDLYGYMAEHDEGFGTREEIPDYPHDVAAAWELVELLREKGYEVTIHTAMLDPSSGDILPGAEVLVWNIEYLAVVGTAPRGEVPLAICRAFVLAMAGGSDASK